MKNKFFYLNVVLFLILGLTSISCNNENNSSDNKSDYITWSTEWSYNDEYHYHEPIRLPYSVNSHTDLINGFAVFPKDYAPHEFSDYTILEKATDESNGTRQRHCDICGYVQKETYKINNVKEAIGTKNNYEIYVKGIVGPSLSGNNGFYIIDESGSIACLVSDNDEMKKISIGDEVVLKGIRKTYKDETNTNIYGQSVIEGVTIDENRHGNHTYSTESFIKNKTLKDIDGLFIHLDHSVDIYTLTATIGYEESDNYAYYDILQGSYRIQLYSDDAKNEYDFLFPYRNQEVEMELAICNFECKTYYKAICLSITVDGNKIFNDYNFTK